jgi:N-acetylglucosaminyldiphosphoundecaprenol N-acetyl-beta-D-mannosaminyltransferase
LPDGIGLRVAAAILGVALRHNLNGTDLLPLLCDRLAAESIPLALVGAAKGVADDCAKNLREKHAGLDVPLVSDGFLDDEASRRFADRARALGRAVVLVGMGSPRQEAWALRYLGDIPGLTVVTVGGLFDFFAGRVTRAPIAWRELGLEWAYRLMQEPRRLGARYLIGNPRFVASAIAQRISGRRAEIA